MTNSEVHTKQQRPWPPRDLDGIREAYVAAVNSVLEAGREDLAHELAARYLQERGAMADGDA